MIQKINGIGLNKFQRVSFKAEEPKESVSLITNPDNEQNIKGLDALSAYNAGLVKNVTEKPFVTPLKPRYNERNINNIAGEKIYNSEGKLDSVISRDENTTTYFYPDKENQEQVHYISTVSKNSGKEVFAQSYEKTDNGEELTVSEYSPTNGELVKRSSYINGELTASTNISTKEDGTKRHVEFDEKSKKYYISADSPKEKNVSYLAEMDNNKQVEHFSEYKTNKLGERCIDVEFYDGMPISYTYSKTMTIPNTAARDKVNNPDLRPSEGFAKIDGLKDIDGEKTYYSNGAIESNKFNSDNGETTAFFSADGVLTKIKDNKKEVVYDGDKQIITEILDDNRTKTTEIFSDNGKYVTVKDDKESKKVRYNENNKPLSYHESSVSENSQEEKCASFYFNEQGMLESYYKY